MSKFERWDRWIDYAAATGIRLERLVIHPADWSGETHYAGLPIRVIGRDQS